MSGSNQMASGTIRRWKGDCVTPSLFDQPEDPDGVPGPLVTRWYADAYRMAIEDADRDGVEDLYDLRDWYFEQFRSQWVEAQARGMNDG